MNNYHSCLGHMEIWCLIFLHKNDKTIFSLEFFLEPMIMAGKKRDDLDLLSFSNPFDTSSCSSEDDNYYPPELVLILKRYQKKDPNTRIKAFADLVAYASDLNEEKASYVISIITRYFGNWVQDPERSIRQDALEI